MRRPSVLGLAGEGVVTLPTDLPPASPISVKTKREQGFNEAVGLLHHLV